MKTRVLVVACAIYCTCIVVANIITAKQIGFFSWTLDAGSVLFPLVYIINDLVVEVYGYRNAKLMIWSGFACTILAVISYTIVLALPGAEVFENQEAFEIVLGSAPRLLAASLCAYLVGSFVNARIMSKMKERGGKLFNRCMLSTVIGEGIDAVVFYVVAFAGVLPFSVIASLILFAYVIKVFVEFVLYPVTRTCIVKVRGASDEGELAGA